MTFAPQKKIRVLIVDDSSVIRTLLVRILSSDPELEVVGTAPDPYVAREKIVQLQPDVMTLDVEMPRMDGLTFLEKVMTHHPVRTVIFSSLSKQNSEIALRAFALGAADVVLKPAIDVTQGMDGLAEELIQVVKNASRTRLAALHLGAMRSAQKKAPASQLLSLPQTTHQLLAIASSTGGTEALKSVLTRLPPDLPGTVIVQHMPAGFTKVYADSLSNLCPFEVKEAQDGDRVQPGKALLAPGNFHMELVRSGAFYHVRLHQQDLLHGVRPAADFLFNSVAKYAGKNAIGAVLTGMGRDGAAGLLAMRNAGSYNIAQDEETCVVFGMPKEAIKLGAIHSTLPLTRIADEIVKQLRLRGSEAA